MELEHIVQKALNMGDEKRIIAIIKGLEILSPEWISNDDASRLLGVKKTTLNQRRYNGWYKPNLDFKHKSDKIIVWNRNALLKRINDAFI